MSGIPPKNGTLKYPATQLVALARLILTEYETHVKAEYDAWNDADDDTETDAGLILDDIHLVNYVVNLPRYVEAEELRRGAKMHPVEYHGVDDPKQAEKALLGVGVQRKAKYVFENAVGFRKETRGQPTKGENWQTEDALIDFLLFLCEPEHKNMFLAA